MKIEVIENVMKYNKDQADKNRKLFKENMLLVLNLLSSPGSGKTSLILETNKKTYREEKYRSDRGGYIFHLRCRKDWKIN